MASADPAPDGVVLWTRVSGVFGPVALHWSVSARRDLAGPVAEGEVTAGPEGDWTAQIAVSGLAPATTYYYRFETRGTSSPVGRTRTARAAQDRGEVRLGVVSCSSWTAGPFRACARLAERDVDLVVHLGDLVYGADSGEVLRPHDPVAAPVTLAGYRARHAQYRTDPDLQRLLASHPLVAVWDDNDVANNAWQGGSPAHDPATQGSWEDRRAAGLRAWLEWTPVRRPEPEAAAERIWRSLPLGGSAELLLVDTRHDGRDRQVSASDPDTAAALDDPDRRLVSGGQRAWLDGRLRSSPAAWRVLANQVMLSPLRLRVPAPFDDLAGSVGLVIDGAVLNPDAWDGYPAERIRLLEVVAGSEVGDTVVLTGDVHSSWAIEVPGPDGPGSDPVAIELVTPSVTAESFAAIVGADSAVLARPLVEVVQSQLPWVRWAELRQHGYLVVAASPERAQGDWWHVDGATGEESRAASWAVAAGSTRLGEAEGLGPRPAAPAPAPDLPAPTPPGDDPRPPWLALGAGGTAVAAAVAAVVGLRRRRRPFRE